MKIVGFVWFATIQIPNVFIETKRWFDFYLLICGSFYIIDNHCHNDLL